MAMLFVLLSSIMLYFLLQTGFAVKLDRRQLFLLTDTSAQTTPAPGQPPPFPTTPPPAQSSPPPLDPPPDLPSPNDPLLQGVVSGLRSSVDQGAVPTSTPGCVTTECIAVYPSVDVFYWPGDNANTACTSTISDQPAAPPQPSDMTSPSIYVVYPPATIYDRCGNTADAGMGPPSTETYKPGELSTLHALPGGSTVPQVFDTNDLPCPPPEIQDQLEPGSAYNPVLIPPFIYDYTIDSPGNITLQCEVKAIKDPPLPARAVRAISGPNDGLPP
ncbi:hypothetical protein MMC21_007968 [Puttea exsequens]|nr:hypothetical protein [Puttea exsequens]